MNSLILKIRRELKENSDEKTRKSSQNFFKERITCHGVKTAIVQKISKEHFALLKGRPKREIFDLCEELWRSGYIEESFVACNWSYSLRREYEGGDFKIFEKWIGSYVSNWASCDTLCNHTVGEFLQMYPGHLAELKKWARSTNRWLRRAAAVSLIVPAKKGKYLNDILQIADLLLLDRDDLVQKGYGWMLKAASQARQKEIYDYVIGKKSLMPRTALRYAIEKMPAALRKKAMGK
ncbi:MAG: DNA alkylation repair protein [Acidobacteriota bacterium]|nr:DNA alkylation repair protein [Acidobacteriota bacterium]